MQNDLTTGSVWKRMIGFSFPILLSNLLQQCYSIVDSVIVGKKLGEDALAAVGGSYQINAIILAIAMGIRMIFLRKCLSKKAFSK